MTTLNTFQEQLADYFGGSTGTALGPGVTGSALQSTDSTSFVIGWQGPAAPSSTQSGTSCGVEVKADRTANASWLDFHSTSGYFNNSYDWRWQSSGGATGTAAQASMIGLGKELDLRCPIRTTPSASPTFGLPFFVDYGKVSVNAGTNQATTINFNITFPLPPCVQITWVDDGAGVQSHDLTEFITATTTTSCTVQCLGTPGAGFSYNWIAIGGGV